MVSTVPPVQTHHIKWEQMYSVSKHTNKVTVKEDAAKKLSIGMETFCAVKMVGPDKCMERM